MNKNNLILIISLLVFLTGCNASKKAAIAASTQKKLELEYQKYKGIPYVYGGSNKRGFDCSGFTQTVYRDAFQIELPRTTKEISQFGKKVSKNKLRPGDLVFFRPSRKYRHVGIFIGNDLFIHSSTSKGVIKSDLENAYWNKKYRYAKRILKTK